MLIATMLMTFYLVFSPEEIPFVVTAISAAGIIKNRIWCVFGNLDLLLSSSLLAVWWHHALANTNGFGMYSASWNTIVCFSSCIFVHMFAVLGLLNLLRASGEIVGAGPSIQPNLLQFVTLIWFATMIVIFFLQYGTVFYWKKTILAYVPLGCVFISRQSQRDERFFSLLIWLSIFGLTYSLREGRVRRFFNECVTLNDFDWLSSFMLVLSLVGLCKLNYMATNSALTSDRVNCKH